MSKTAMIRARIEPEIKDKAERVFKKLGLSATQAITLFYHQVVLCNGLPFNVALPSSAKRKQSNDSCRDR